MSSTPEGKSLTIRNYLEVGEDNHLKIHGVDLVDLSDEYGSPLFVFDEVTLLESFRRFRQAFEKVYPKILVCYSLKTNNNLGICRTLAEDGAAADASSELDLFVARKSGFSGERIIYDGPFKPKAILRKALEMRVLLVNMESIKEMQELNAVAGDMGVEQAVGLRINPFKRPSFFKSLHPNALLEAGYGWPSCRFGFPEEEVRSVFKRLKEMKNLRLECIMMHPYSRALNVLMPLWKEAEEFGFELKYLNVGGGFDPGMTGYTSDFLLMLDFVRRKFGLKSSLDKAKQVRSIESVANSLIEALKQQLGNLPEPTLITEPGRFITGPSAMLLVEVDHIKTAGGHRWIMVNGGTNILPIIDERRKILVANNATASSKELASIVGPLLYPKDFIAIRMPIPHVKEGDLIVVPDCGAYSISSSTQFLYPRPAAVLVNSEGKAKLIREKETPGDVVSKDRL